MATIAVIPREKIDRIQLFVNNERMTLAAIKAQSGADYAINGTLYDMGRWLPVMHYRVDGHTMVSDPYNYYGYGWDSGADVKVTQSRDKNSVRNYVCGVELVRDGKPCSKLYYDSAVGGARGRTAIAIKGDDLILYCVGDGQAGRCTPEELRGEMVALGAQSAVMLDGGLSSQCIFPTGAVASSRIVENVILVYVKKEEKDMPPDYECTVCLDPGHGGKDNSNGAPDGSYKEHEFTLDLAKRLRKLLLEQGIKVVMTRESDTYIDLQPRCNIANNANATLFLSIHTNAVAGGWNSSSGLCAYTYAEGGKRNDLANAILSRMKEYGVKLFSTPLWHKGFHVLKYTNMPACLVEYGFHTSKEDVALLKSSAYRDKLALATAKGICDYLHKTWKETEKPAEPEQPKDEQPKRKYTVQFAVFDDKNAAQKVVDKLAEIGIQAVVAEK